MHATEDAMHRSSAPQKNKDAPLGFKVQGHAALGRQQLEVEIDEGERIVQRLDGRGPLEPEVGKQGQHLQKVLGADGDSVWGRRGQLEGGGVTHRWRERGGTHRWRERREGGTITWKHEPPQVRAAQHKRRNGSPRQRGPVTHETGGMRVG